MTQTATSKSFRDRIDWDGRIKPLLTTLLFVALAFLAGLYIAAPVRAARQPAHLPASYLAMPLGAVQVTNPDGSSALLPVRVADTSAARLAGLKGVGPRALDNQFLLYGLTRPTTSRTSYSVEGARTPLEYAVVDPEGVVVATYEAPLGTERISIPDPHRWLIATSTGTLARFGIGVGSRIDPETLRKF